MAKRRSSTPGAVPDTLRDAVERTVQATQLTRDRAQEAVDELVKGTEARAGRVRRGAETGAESVRERVKGAFDPLRPATAEDLRELRGDLRAIVRRLDAIEESLGPGSGGRSGAAKRPSGSGKGSSSTRARETSAAQRTAAARKTSAGRGKSGAKKSSSRSSSRRST